MKKIVLITTGQPSLNPRIVKEADALHKAGYSVTLLYCYWISWATETDKRILQEAGWNHQLVGGRPADGKTIYNFTRLRLKINRHVNKLLGNGFLIAERAQARCYDELLAAAKKIKADWYIGHNLGALPVAVNAARFHHAKAGFDFEDYHRGETGPGEKAILQRIIFLENKYLSSLHYFSGASAMITAATKKNHRGFKGVAITLLNCFPLNQQPPFNEKKENDTSLQLFWFSQTIGINRGLEALINALRILNDGDIHLTLAGRCDEAMLNYITTYAGKILSNIHFAGIIQPEELPAFAAQFDVGMAIELTVPPNRDICLTNKIFTYLLAGNAIILSETSMQLAFNEAYKIGESFAVNDGKALAEKIKGYQNPEKLNVQKRHNYELANKQLNWEKESEKLLMLLR
ncbi:MAG: hypothetical protein H7Z13_04570 [Ferruginibacter sp.]|nr:hypothetical protein [Ferruginibacter sp.]